MKLKYKINIIMLVVLITAFAFVAISVLGTIRQGTIQDKCANYGEILQQVLISYELVSNEIEYSFFDFIKTQSIGNTIALERPAQKKVKLSWKLDTFISISPWIKEEAFVVDLDNAFYFSSTATNETKQNIRSVFPLFSTNNEVSWVSYNGNVYLCRSIYSFAPYIKRGYLIAKIDSQYLITLTGMSFVPNARFVVMQNNDSFLFSTDKEMTMLPEGMHKFASYEKQWDTIQGKDGKEYVYCLQNQNSDGKIMLLIPQKIMLAKYYKMSSQLVVVFVLLLVFGLGMSFLSANGLTKNISRLMASIKDNLDGTADNQLVKIRGTDEIAELAERFNELLQYRTQVSEAQYNLLELKYRFIQSQVSPHFMSNILSSVTSYSMLGEGDRMDELCTKTSRYLKNNLRAGDKRFVTLRHEMDTLNDYVEIYQLCNAHEVNLQIICPEEIEECTILSMMLQPIIENALLHAIDDTSDVPLKITIQAFSDGEKIQIIISDNGCGMSQSNLMLIQEYQKDPLNGTITAGFGIGSVLQRLHLQYGNKYCFSVTSEQKKGTQIKISYPISMSE